MPIRILYQSVQQPILTAAQRPETVTESRWHRALSEPVRTRAAGYAVALIASGMAVIGPFQSPSEPSWHQALSEPVKAPPRLTTGAQQFSFFVAAAPFAETVSEDRWHEPFSEPVRSRPGLAPYQQQSLAFVEAAPFAETVTEDRWHQPLSLPPVMVPPRLATGAQQSLAFVKAEPFTGIVSADSWFRHLAEPVRGPPRLVTGAQQFAALVEAAPFGEAVSEDRWHQPWSEPVRFRQGLFAPGQAYAAALVEAPPFGETVTESRWHQPFSEPVRLPRQVLAGAQQFLAYSTAVIAPAVVLDRWHRSFSQPVRSRPGLGAYAQQFTTLVEAEPFFTNGLARLVQGATLDDEVELYDLDATAIGGDIYRFTSTAFPNDMIRWNGNAYGPIPVKTSGWQWSGRGPLPTPLLQVSNVSLAFGAAVTAFQDLVGATLTRTRTFRRFLDGQPDADPDAHFPLDIYRIDRKRLQTNKVVEWELAAVMDQQGLYLPRRPILRNACTHRYRRFDTDALTFDYTHATCPYAGSAYFEETGATTADPAADHCGKRLTDCKKRFGALPLPTRAFPGVARLPT